MKPIINHSWDISEEEATELQLKLSKKIIKKDDFNEAKLIAGVDVAYSKSSQKLVAGIVVFDVLTLKVIEKVIYEDVEKFPYIPGLFSFRELPPLIKAFSMLTSRPDIIICDAQGYAHPRRFGLASHLGVVLDVPTIGCGKSKLLGEYKVPSMKRGSMSPLIDNEEIIGSVLRTQDNVNPIFVSIGHRVSLITACDLVLKFSPNYRLPETTRHADQLVNRYIKNKMLY